MSNDIRAGDLVLRVDGGSHNDVVEGGKYRVREVILNPDNPDKHIVFLNGFDGKFSMRYFKKIGGPIHQDFSSYLKAKLTPANVAGV